MKKKIAKEIYTESVEYFCKRNIEVLSVENSSEADFAVVIGGDGTLLRSFKHFIFRSKMYVIAINAGSLGFLTEIKKEKVFEEYEKLADIYLQRQLEGWGEKFNFFHFRMDLYRGPCMAKRLRGCGAGHEYMAIVPNGDIYPCHQFVGKDGFVIGNVYEGLQNTEIPKDFRNTHVFSKPTCAECWAKFFCSGGCHANNITLGGDLETPYEFGCRLQKKRIECAIMIQAELEQAGIDGSIPVALG